ncbi:hypothetical protein MIND_00149600 [Mycena indigotica]|uniref:DUF7330 domain-containing protein n=1 Tax=Mycena indigotica TaxID=2126181 RepID=A0A8H6TFI0_9AGAR|nr:uncharacterized protein MIND_00149600 [Mycena indigotica]KAF7316309.1 hypothetical protein MIND_00149600 [Mycena indigotica]
MARAQLNLEQLHPCQIQLERLPPLFFFLSNLVPGLELISKGLPLGIKGNETVRNWDPPFVPTCSMVAEAPPTYTDSVVVDPPGSEHENDAECPSPITEQDEDVVSARLRPDSLSPSTLVTPRRRPTTATDASTVAEVRLSLFPDHKIFQPSRASSTYRRDSAVSADATATAPATTTPNPTNFVSVFRKTHKRAFSFGVGASRSIKGSFAVNPFLDIPGHLLAPLGSGETTRKNLRLKVENGGIDVDVYLVGEPTQHNTGPVKRTELHFELCGGFSSSPLLARIHTPTLRRPPVHISLVSQNGFVSLHLPLSFHGLLRVSIAAGDLNDHITLSAALAPHTTILAEDATSRAYFVGSLGAGRWEGDRAEVDAKSGRVRVQFSGDVERDLDGLRRVGWELMGL